jgi:hypothetical protein
VAGSGDGLRLHAFHLHLSVIDFGLELICFRYRKSDAPAYHQGHAIMIGLLSLSLVCMFPFIRMTGFANHLIVSLFMVYYLNQKNRKMDRDMAQAETEGGGIEKTTSVGVEHTSSSFRYML